MESNFEQIINGRNNFYFISPHIDDVIFSCGAFFNKLASEGKKIGLINIFTKGDPVYQTRFNRKYLNKCGFDNVEKFFEARKKEEESLSSQTDASIFNLDFIDAGWRFRDEELIFRTNDDDFDISTVDKIAEKIAGIIKPANSKTLVFLPIGVGRHIDHLMTRSLNRYFGPGDIVYYAEFPYILRHQLPDAFIRRHNLVEFLWNSNLLSKKELMLCYVSQLPSIFANRGIPLIGERLFISRNSL